MERIQEAIAKARAERQGAIGQTPTPGEGPLPRQPDQPRLQPRPQHAEAPRPSAPPPPIAAMKPVTAYTQTRRVALQDDALKAKRVIAGFVADERVEAYRQLRTQVLKMMRANQWNTLAITSAHENAGKTLTAVNLAISMSRDVNQTVLLVDLDLRRSSVHQTLGIEIEHGIVDCINAGMPVSEVLINPGFERLVILPCLPQGQYASEILSSPEMRRLIDDIKHRYESRIIIFDLPPLLRNDDAMMITHMLDATLLVVEDGVTTEEDLTRSMQLLEGVNLLGTVLNKAR